jgi:hypothetical protein
MTLWDEFKEQDGGAETGAKAELMRYTTWLELTLNNEREKAMHNEGVLDAIASELLKARG